MEPRWRTFLQTIIATFRNPPRFPPGHYYSPLPAQSEIEAQAGRLREASCEAIPGIDLRTDEQLKLLEHLRPYYGELPFTEVDQGATRYFYDNGVYCYADGIFLFLALRHFNPRTIVEIGSGLSSALIVDTNERFFDNRITCCFVDPSMDRLKSRLNEADLKRAEIHQARVQDIPLSFFDRLQQNDILFIDSSHVVKFASDLHYLMFEVLPRLAEGVIIHFHDIFYPFEYPEAWLREGIAWNEAYMLRAFLSHNSNYDILLFTTYLQRKFPDFFSRHFPLCAKNTGGSLWIQKHTKA